MGEILELLDPIINAARLLDYKIVIDDAFNSVVIRNKELYTIRIYFHSRNEFFIRVFYKGESSTCKLTTIEELEKVLLESL